MKIPRGVGGMAPLRCREDARSAKLADRVGGSGACSGSIAVIRMSGQDCRRTIELLGEDHANEHVRQRHLAK